MRHLTSSALAAWALLLPLAAWAQTSEAERSPAPGTPDTPQTDEQGGAPDPNAVEAPAAPRMTPPRLVKAVEPIYPESERQSGRAASVLLTLTLDAEGAVTDAVVTESGGAAFDASALEAGKKLSFSPALSGDTPVGAKIPFRFDFALAAPPPPPPAPMAAPSVQPAPEPTPGALGSLDIEVEGERRSREPTLRALETEELTKAPGTNGDALRAVQNLPGVARPPGLAGLLIVRGSSPRDTQVFMDGTNVPLAYHFGGLSSVVPSEMLETLDFYPGNFGPEFGRVSGGIINIGSKSPRQEGWGGLFQVDTLDARALAEVAITEDTRVLIGGRRSWVDVWLGPVLEEAGAQVTTAPVYYDYQALIEHDITNDTTLRLFGFGSDDRLKLLLTSPDEADPANGGNVELHTGFWRVQGRADTRLTENLRWTTTVSAGHDVEQFSSGNINLDIGIDRLDARSELRAQLLPELSVLGGVDVETGSYDVIWRAPPIDIDNGDTSGPLFGRPLTELHADGTFTRPAGYVQMEIAPFTGLQLMPGIRADYYQDAEDWSVDPRLGVRYDLPGFERRTTLKGGVGMYHQPPEPYESIEPFGTPGIESERALHYSLGFERELSRPLEISVEGFYKDLGELVIGTQALESESGITYVNEGVGRAYGGELLLRYKPEGRFFGWVAYTLSRSERKDGPDDSWERFDYDQTHILTALGSMKLGRGWQLGARFRYVTGSPYTPNVGGIVDYDAGVYAPLQGENNSRRLPAFHQLDLRVDKTWEFASWKLATYLDLQNVYNRKNTESIDYNYDFSESKPLPGLPILPVIGIRGEL